MSQALFSLLILKFIHFSFPKLKIVAEIFDLSVNSKFILVRISLSFAIFLSDTSSKTKLVKDKLDQLGLKEVLIITEGLSENLYLGVRNIPKVDVMDTNELNPYSLIGFEKVLITQAAVEKVEEWLS